MTENAHISEEDLALYAMRSLSGDEAAAARAHLAACALCRSQMEEVSSGLALVGLSAEQKSLPDGARARFIAKLGNEPRNVEVAVVELAGERRKRGIGFWVPWLVAAALAIAAITLGTENYVLNDQLRDESSLVANLAAKASRAQQVLEVLTSPSAQHVLLTPGRAPSEPAGRATYLADRGGLVFFANNLKPLPKDKIYELWVIPANGKPPLPAGLFQPDAQGLASVVLPPLPPGVPAKAFGVTVEKASGSGTPTPPILLMGAAPGE